MSFPSAKRLELHFPGKGKELRSLIEGTVKPDTYGTVREWIKACYHKPKTIECQMLAINEVLEGHGVEAVFGDDPRWPDMEYVNMGDTYTTTIVYDWTKDRFEIASWGDWVERAERNGKEYT